MRRGAAIACLVVAAAALGGAHAGGPEGQASARQERESPAWVAQGLASWYGKAFHGRRTASGERFDMHDFTAAHPFLPFGTIVEVRSLVNDRTVRVRINDRGPFVGKRIIDLSRAAAAALGLVKRGVKRVQLRVVEPGEAQAELERAIQEVDRVLRREVDGRADEGA